MKRYCANCGAMDGETAAQRWKRRKEITAADQPGGSTVFHVRARWCQFCEPLPQRTERYSVRDGRGLECLSKRSHAETLLHPAICIILYHSSVLRAVSSIKVPLYTCFDGLLRRQERKESHGSYNTPYSLTSASHPC
jgi:hypothetical protein